VKESRTRLRTWGPEFCSTEDLWDILEVQSPPPLDDLSSAGLGLCESFLGRGGGLRMSAALELARRATRPRERTATRFVSAAAVHAWALPRLRDVEHEELWLLSLSRTHQLVAARRLGQGGGAGLSVERRDIFRVALREGAHAILLLHNHPSGDPEPSEQDIFFTRTVEAAGRIVGVPLLDHVVVAREGYASMLERGIIADGSEARSRSESPGTRRWEPGETKPHREPVRSATPARRVVPGAPPPAPSPR